MQRLTIRNSDGSYSQPTHTTFEKMFYKLAEFEDLMEQEEFTSLEDLKAYIKLQSKGSSDLIQENKALKDRWKKLKSFIEDKNIMWTYFDLLDKIQELEEE